MPPSAMNCGSVYLTALGLASGAAGPIGLRSMKLPLRSLSSCFSPSLNCFQCSWSIARSIPLWRSTSTTLNWSGKVPYTSRYWSRSITARYSAPPSLTSGESITALCGALTRSTQDISHLSEIGGSDLPSGKGAGSAGAIAPAPSSPRKSRRVVISLPVLEHVVEITVLGRQRHRAAIDEQVPGVGACLEDVAGGDDKVGHLADLQRAQSIGHAEDLRW